MSTEQQSFNPPTTAKDHHEKIKTYWDDDIWKTDGKRPLVVALDQGTSSTRVCLVTQTGRLLAWAQMEHEQIYPRQGWHEHDPIVLIQNSLACVQAVQQVLTTHTQGSGGTSSTSTSSGGTSSGGTSINAKIAAIGITNQRETTLAWNRKTGMPYYNAIVWDDARTAHIAMEIGKDGDKDCLRAATGLPLSSYFAGTKVRWLLDHVQQLRTDLQNDPDQVCFGTIDTWLVYQLTGQVPSPSVAAASPHHPPHLRCRGQFVTDVTNASRWLFLDLQTQKWDPQLVDRVCAPHKVPLTALPTVVASSRIYGKCTVPMELIHNVPIAAVLGDQQAALFGQTAFSAGQAKNTYGTGLFLMMNTGPTAIPSTHGLLTTIAYQMEGQPVQYALEGSVAHAGSTIQWLRDKLQIIDSAPDTEDLATETNEGLYFVPAFGGLFCPHWRADARACLVGLTASHHKGHVCRAALEAAAYQTVEVLQAMQADSGITLSSLKVDGGASANRLLMQFQADMLAVPVIQPVVMETTSLGAAFAAGLAVGVWESMDELASLWAVQHTFEPQLKNETRQKYMAEWKKAVSKSLGWVLEDMPKEKKKTIELRNILDVSTWTQGTALTVAIGSLLVGIMAGRWSRRS